MSGNGDAVKRKVKEWLRHADDDLRLARVAFKLKSAVPYKWSRITRSRAPRRA